MNDLKFNDTVEKYTTSTPGHADGFNKRQDILLENDKYLNLKLEDIAIKQGDLSTLKTTDKTSLVNSINELFTNVSSGKFLLGTAITDIDKNVKVPTDATFKELANAVKQISTGKKWASGEFDINLLPHVDIIGSEGKLKNMIKLEVNNLTFSPSVVIIGSQVRQYSDMYVTVMFKNGLYIYGTNKIVALINTGRYHIFSQENNIDIITFFKKNGFEAPISIGRYSINDPERYWVAYE